MDHVIFLLILVRMQRDPSTRCIAEQIVSGRNIKKKRRMCKTKFVINRVEWIIQGEAEPAVCT